MRKLELRPMVYTFAQQMELVLRDNDHKEPPEEAKYVSKCIIKELGELLDAEDEGDCDAVLKEAVDVANFAAMFASIYHDDLPSVDEKWGCAEALTPEAAVTNQRFCKEYEEALRQRCKSSKSTDIPPMITESSNQRIANFCLKMGTTTEELVKELESFVGRPISRPETLKEKLCRLFDEDRKYEEEHGRPATKICGVCKYHVKEERDGDDVLVCQNRDLQHHEQTDMPLCSDLNPDAECEQFDG